MIKLAFQRLFFNKISSLVTIFTVMITVLVFLLLNSSLEDYKDRLTARTNNDLLIAGSRGSGADLIMKALYFRNVEQQTFKFDYLNGILKDAQAAPMFIQYSAQGFPVCSTSLDYFNLRSLEVEHGNLFTKLGDCLLGAEVAKKLNLTVGDSLLSDPDNVFDPAGSIPVKLKVKGILKRSSTPDDNAVFTSLKTGWTMHGLGHAHPEEEDSPSLKISFLEITDETMKTFHFHGDMEDYPLTAILLKPKSASSRAFLYGESSVTTSFAVIDPKEGLSGFLDMLFHIDKLFLIILVLIVVAIFLLYLLVFFLSLRLRRQEKNLFDRLGFEKAFFSRLVATEWFILLNVGINGGLILNIILNPVYKEIFDSILRG